MTVVFDLENIVITVNNDVNHLWDFNVEVFIKKVLFATGFKQGNFEFSFVSDQKMIALNQQYFDKQKTTDVISFNLGSIDNPSADIYISIQEARRNIIELGHTLDNEIQILIIHGILHVKGYEDYNESQRSIMFKEQDKILKVVEGL